MRPMFEQIEEKPFPNNNWGFEEKVESYRSLATIVDGKVDLYSRNMISFNDNYPSIVEELEKIEHTVVFDGEILREDEKGRTGFQLLQSGKGNLRYHVFDLLHLNGYDLVELPLLNRKELLKQVIENSNLKEVAYSPQIKEYGIEFYQTAEDRQLEGIMAKNSQSPYRAGKRSTEWLKIKIVEQQETVIAGITEPKGSRKHFGALVLAVRENAMWKYVGHCGTGFTAEALEKLYGKMKPYFTDASPFNTKIPVNAKVQWLKPELVCEIKFTEWTNEIQMRHPVFLGLRPDKNPFEVKRGK